MEPLEFLRSLVDYSSLITIRTLEPVDTPIAISRKPAKLLDKLPIVKVKGKDLVFQSGNSEVSLTPIGAGDDYFGPFYHPDFSWDTALEKIKEYPKFKVLRLSFETVSTLDSPHTPINFEALDKILQKIQDAGLYVILDCHHYLIPLTWRNFWIEQWLQIAHHYKNASVVLAYELCNEPVYIGVPIPRENVTFKVQKRVFVDAYKNCAKGIQLVDPTHPVVLQVEPWRIPPEYIPELMTIPNAIFTFHLWTHSESMASMLQNLEWSFDYYQTIQDEFNVPMWLGEYGMYFEDDLDLQWYWMKTATEMAKQRGWGYCTWMLGTKGYLSHWDYLFKL